MKDSIKFHYFSYVKPAKHPLKTIEWLKQFFSFSEISSLSQIHFLAPPCKSAGNSKQNTMYVDAHFLLALTWKVLLINSILG